MFSIDTDSGLLRGVRQVLSTHCDERPPGAAAELIVVHNISLPPGVYGGPYIEQLFTGNLPVGAHPYFATIPAGRVSAHALIHRAGEVVQFVPFGERAWHAGVSSWCGRAACNDFSIGIELEGADDVPYEPAQYRSLAGLITALCRTYPGLSTERLVGHDQIAPGRKTDPGASFDWPRLRQLLAASIGSSP